MSAGRVLGSVVCALAHYTAAAATAYGGWLAFWYSDQDGYYQTVRAWLILMGCVFVVTAVLGFLVLVIVLIRSACRRESCRQVGRQCLAVLVPEWYIIPMMRAGGVRTGTEAVAAGVGLLRLLQAGLMVAALVPQTAHLLMRHINHHYMAAAWASALAIVVSLLCLALYYTTIVLIVGYQKDEGWPGPVRCALFFLLNLLVTGGKCLTLACIIITEEDSHLYWLALLVLLLVVVSFIWVVVRYTSAPSLSRRLLLGFIVSSHEAFSVCLSVWRMAASTVVYLTLTIVMLVLRLSDQVWVCAWVCLALHVCGVLLWIPFRAMFTHTHGKLQARVSSEWRLFAEDEDEDEDMAWSPARVRATTAHQRY